MVKIDFLKIITFNRQMSVEQEYCLDPETQSECYSTKPQPLSNGQAVFFVVLPKFMNVDIRIVIGKNLT
jgi:hypothetical protein